MTNLEPEKTAAVLGAEEAALVELAGKIVQAAIVDRASDIHIDPTREGTTVRFRVDGVMHDVLTLPRNVHTPLTSRFMLMAGMDAGDRVSIQHGRVPVEQEGREYDLRETALPAIYGEKLVLRILDQRAFHVRLDQIGMRAADRQRLEECLHRPCGLLIFSGPAGSGKTTVMYGALDQINKPDRTLYSIEDPVEVRLPGVLQMNINRRAGILFPQALRGLVRADPDIIMVGEVPDRETADLCLQAALTGHLVLTQLHADEAVTAIRRLRDIGVTDSYLLSESLLMVSSQRLVRRICASCKAPAEYPGEVMAGWRTQAEAGGLAWPEEPPTFHRGQGCDACKGYGYRGRMGIFEILVMNHELGRLVAMRADDADIRQAAIRQGMTTLLADGFAKAMAGETTVEEVLRVLAGVLGH